MIKMRFFLIAIVLLVVACKSSEKKTKTAGSKEGVLMTLAGDPVYTSEFSYVYNKNHQNAEDAYSEKSIREYLNLYTNFRLRVKEAESLGLDTAASFKKELEGYKKQLAQPYLTEKGVTDQLVRESYERLKEEIKASHILINVSPDADPEDTLKAYNKLIDLRNRILSGEKFEDVAAKYSNDPSAESNKGDLGYFTALQMVYSFEDMAYKTPVGQVSMPVRTKFGYHILKVTDRRKSMGQMHVAHIMVRATEGIPAKDSIEAKQKIDEIYARLKKGEDWNTLLQQFTDDLPTKNTNGELPWFTTGRMTPNFEEAAYKLEKPGDISEPVLTPYGWHIIKLLERKGLDSYTEMEPMLKAKVSRDSRSELNKSKLIQRLKKENNFSENPKALDVALTYADSTILKAKSNYSIDKKADQQMFEINNKNYMISDFFKFIKDRQRIKKDISPAQYMRVMYKDFTEDRLIAYEEAHLEEKYVDYKMLVKEYRDGILLFQLMDEKVWSKAVQDTSGLKNFFEKNRESYRWDKRAKATIYNLSDKILLDSLKQQLNNGRFELQEKKSKVQFASGSSQLTEENKKTLEKYFRDTKKDATITFVIEGMSENSEKGDKDLGVKRANMIKQFFIEKGIDSSKISIVNAGRKTLKDKKEEAHIAIVHEFSTSKKVLQNNFNANAPLTLQVQEGMFQKGDNPVLDKAEWKTGTQIIEQDGRLYYIVIEKVEEPRLKAFEEARGLVISDYQSNLEQEWLKELKNKYPVVINEEEVKKLIKPQN